MDNPLVSIVVVAYNSSKFIHETLESCKAQTYKNLELVITDDASTDNTVALCEEWLFKNESFFKSVQIVKSTINTGLSANLNRGVFSSKGEYFKLLAGDDLLPSNCIEIFTKVIFGIKGKNSQIFFSYIKKFRIEEGCNEKTWKKVEFKKSIFRHPDITAEDQYKLALRGICPSLNTFFISKEIFEAVGGCDEDIKLLEDGPLILKLLKLGEKINFIEKVTYLYRIHSTSIYQNTVNQFIYRSWIFNSHFPFLFKYTYNNLSTFEKGLIQSKYILAKLTVKLGMNKWNWITYILNRALNYPLEIMEKWNKKRFRNYYLKKYGEY